MHEDILRLVVHEHGSGDGDDSDDEMDTAAYLLSQEGVSVSSQDGKQTDSSDEGSIDRSATALRHLRLLKLAYQRLGSWPKPYSEYEHLNAQIFREFGADPEWKGVQGTETWDAKGFGSGKAEFQDGAFVGIGDWKLGREDTLLHAQGQRVAQGHGNGANGLSNGANRAIDGANGLAVEKVRGQARQVAVGA